MRPHRKRRYAKFFMIIGFCLGLALVFTSASAAPKVNSNARGGDCGSCHGKEKVLPDNHPDTKATDWQGCKTCHGGEIILAGKLPGSHVHRLSGLSCSGCHPKGKRQEAMKSEKCLTCHDTEKVGEKTAGVKPENPHKSPHYGSSLGCDMCHHQHAKSENYCAQCHRFEFRVP